MHRAAGTITMSNSSEFMLNSLPGCVAAGYQPEPQLQGTLISTLKGNSKTLTYLLLSLHHAGKVVALVGSNNRIAFQCFSCCIYVVDTAGLHIVWTVSFQSLIMLKMFLCSPFCNPYHYLFPGILSLYHVEKLLIL